MEENNKIIFIEKKSDLEKYFDISFTTIEENYKDSAKILNSNSHPYIIILNSNLFIEISNFKILDNLLSKNGLFLIYKFSQCQEGKYFNL